MVTGMPADEERFRALLEHSSAADSGRLCMVWSAASVVLTSKPLDMVGQCAHNLSAC